MTAIEADPDLAADAPMEERALLSDMIRQTLSDEIATGRLRPGTALDEQQLADRFGTSRTPVREALRQLSVTGMVEIRPRRGVFVTAVTSEQIMDMFETMAELEAMCVRLATYRMTPAERSKLYDMHHASTILMRDGDVAAYDAFNRNFHETIYAATRNQFMASQTAAVRSRLAAFRRTQLRRGDRLVQSHAEHGEILHAMARGDGEESARCMRAHMLNASHALMAYIAELRLG
ncbi:GntR family transcriptional regulator [Niveispirillum fermenti]|uniref:GntR family transcriptional regulator n=1 Tax=Niveispirillum fermenti TaxID=1233113 RepID=UPI003A8BEA21